VKFIHFLRSLALALMTAIILFEGVTLALTGDTSHLRLMMETKAHPGGADEEPKGTHSTTSTLRAEFRTVSQARPAMRHFRTRPAHFGIPSSNNSERGMTTGVRAASDSRSIRPAVLRTVVLRV
jgi:hypothetical protein